MTPEKEKGMDGIQGFHGNGSGLGGSAVFRDKPKASARNKNAENSSCPLRAAIWSVLAMLGERMRGRKREAVLPMRINAPP
ncbi:MAG: hypothetical protein LBD68_08940 [Zoogloeaceae bacterium]|jgi:hypothetical protein|nr:hypothetical protein [Zoogloeaceae bacterium]